MRSVDFLIALFLFKYSCLFQDTIFSFHDAPQKRSMGTRWYAFHISLTTTHSDTLLNETQLSSSTRIGFWTNDCTNTSPPIRSYSSLSTPVLGYVLGSRYIMSLFHPAVANSMIRTYLSSPTTKPRSSSWGSCRISPPSPLRPMLNLLILVLRQIGRMIRKEGRGGRRLGRERICRCMYRYVCCWFFFFRLSCRIVVCRGLF